MTKRFARCRPLLVGVLMAQSPSNRYQTRMVYKNLVYGALSD